MDKKIRQEHSSKQRRCQCSGSNSDSLPGQFLQNIGPSLQLVVSMHRKSSEYSSRISQLDFVSDASCERAVAALFACLPDPERSFEPVIADFKLGNRMSSAFQMILAAVVTYDLIV